MDRRSRSRRGRLWAGVYVALFGLPDDADSDADGTGTDESDRGTPPEG